MSTYSAEDLVEPEVLRKGLERFGYLGKDSFGRLYIDACKTNEEHLKNHVEGKERPGCRLYLEDLFPDDWLGKRVLVDIQLALVTHHERPK